MAIFILRRHIYLNLGKRIAISALLSDSGFHLPSIDIFESDQNHNMDSERFLNWIEQTSCRLRRQLGNSFHPNKVVKINDLSIGPSAKVVIVLDNATWHNRLTDETSPPKRSWRKELIIEWLRRHNIPLPVKATKAELIELAFSNLPQKRYMTDELAAKYSIAVLR
jgi:hypothetical protein